MRSDTLVCNRRQLLVGLPLCIACSATAVDEPPPRLDTAGSFIASPNGSGGYLLFRTLLGLRLETETVLFMLRYGVMAASINEARALAQSHSLGTPREFESHAMSEFERVGFEVVWFRTLTDDERAVLS
ncbi:MAG: hypothetical protein ACOY0T_00145 [Myxococcota bacterium]